MPKAYSYIRFSTPDQIKGDSLRRQTELSKQYAEVRGLELDTTLNLRDLGVSAYDNSNIKKGALGQFLHLVENGRIESGSYLLVESLDRISRAQVMDALHVFLGILNAGISIVTLADGAIYSRESANDNWGSLVMSIVIMSRATEESATKSKRIRAAWDNKRANVHIKRLTSRCPYWMKPTFGDSGFELIPERVDVVKRIFQMAKEGIGNSTIVKRLNEETISTFSDKTNGWQPSYVQKLLRNKAVYGAFQMSLQRSGEITSIGEPIPNYYPPIMSKEEWLWVNSIRADRRTRGGVSKGKHLSNIFSGLLQCGYCGGSMVMGGYVKKKINGEKRSGKYVACSNGRRGLGCYFIQWNYPDLEQQILQFCRSVDFAEVLGKKNNSGREVEEARKKVIRIQAEIAACESKITNLGDALEEGMDDKLSLRSIVNRIKKIENELENLKKDKEQAELNAVQLASHVAEQSRQQGAIVELFEQLQTLDGSKLHDLRIRLSERIKKVIALIGLYPGGQLLSDKRRKTLEANLAKTGYAMEEIKIYLDSLGTVPNKADKYMLMVFKNNDSLLVSNGKVRYNLKETMPIEEYLRGAN